MQSEVDEYAEKVLLYAKLADKIRPINQILNSIATDCIALSDHKLLQETAEIMAQVSKLYQSAMENRQVYKSQEMMARQIGAK
jgi:hypothetical protein